MIRQTKAGHWIIDNDTHISRWVEEHGALQHDYQTLPAILEFIHEGNTVMDIGAHIGDTAAPFKAKVGERGVVIAFEPNPEAFECLQRNCPTITSYNAALSDRNGGETLWVSRNTGAGYIGERGIEDDPPIENEFKILTAKLDSFYQKVDFIKIDAEGSELKILQGGTNLIDEFGPKMAIELNEYALRRQGDSIVEVLKWLDDRDYQVFPITPANHTQPFPQYDALALPCSS